MIYLNAFLLCGLLCMAAQLIYDSTQLTPGHITSMLVILGSLLESFNIYDALIRWCGMGANLPITSFGHSLTHAALKSAENEGWIGIFTGVFDKSASGISFAIFVAFWIAILFRSHD